MDRDRFKGRNVFITGAGSGFGRATAVKFAEQGADNLYLVDLMPDRLERVEAEVKKHGAKPHPIKCNILELTECDRAIETALKISPRLDVVISNAATDDAF